MRNLNISIDGEYLDLYEGTIIALTRQVNNIAELKDRQADYSNQFSIPKTANNVRILLSNKYTKHPAMLELYGSTILGYMIVKNHQKDIKCEFYSGALNFFELIEGLKLEELDFCQYEHKYNLANFMASATNEWNDCYVYPLIDWCENNAMVENYFPTPSSPFERRYYWEGSLPAIFVRKIMTQIVEQQGWKLAGKILDDERFEQVVVPCVANNRSRCKAGLYLKGNENRSIPAALLGIPYNTNLANAQPHFFRYVSNTIQNPVDGQSYPMPFQRIGQYNEQTIVQDEAFTITGASFNTTSLYPLDPNGAIIYPELNIMPEYGPNLSVVPPHPNSLTWIYVKADYDMVGDIEVQLETAYNIGVKNRGGTQSVVFNLDKMYSVRVVAYQTPPDSSVPNAMANHPYRIISEWVYGVDYFNHGIHIFTSENVQIYKGEYIALVCMFDTISTRWDFFNPPPVIDGMFIGYNSHLKMTNLDVTSSLNIPLARVDQYIGLANNLPDMSQKDFLKMIAQRFCLIFDADSTSRTLTMYSFSEIYDNIPIAYDWSDKVADEYATIDNHSSYSQENLMLYSNDASINNTMFGGWQFDIADTSLKLSSTALTLAYSGTETKNVWADFKIPYINLWGAFEKIDNDGNPVYRFDKPKNKPKGRLLTMHRTKDFQGIVYVLGESVAAANTFSPSTNTYPLAYFLNVQNYPYDKDLGMYSAIVNEYADLIRCLQNYELIIETFYLTPEEFLGFNNFIPVYLQKHNAYFYVNKISSYVEGKPVKVELLKLI